MNLAAVSDAEILAMMAGQSESPTRARAAWGELYSRHRRYLYVVVNRAYGTFLGESGTIDLVVDAFRRAYEWAGRQASEEAVRIRFTADTLKSTRRQVLGWLGAIAERLFKDRYRDSARRATRFEDYVDDLMRCESPEQEEPQTNGASPMASRVRAALAALDPMDREVLQLSLPWYELNTRSFAVPRGEGAKLASVVGMSPDAFRQRRHRALRKLEQSLQQSEQVEAEERR